MANRIKSTLNFHAKDFAPMAQLKALRADAVPFEARAVLRARIAELESKTASQHEEIQLMDVTKELLIQRAKHLETQLAELKSQKDAADARLDKATKDLDEFMAAGSSSDPDQVRAHVALSKPMKTGAEKWEALLFRAQNRGMYAPLYTDVDLLKKVGPGNGRMVAGLVELHELIRQEKAVYISIEKVPDGADNLPQNRVQMYEPFSAEEQSAFEALFKAAKKPQRRDVTSSNGRKKFSR